MSVRKVVIRTGRNYRGEFPSLKNNRMVGWESFHERDAILLLEYHPEVVRFEAQPTEETYYDGLGELHRYVPDLQAVFADGRELFIEVKPMRAFEDATVRAKLGAIARRFEEQGRNFRVMTSEDIRRQPLFGNLQRIHAGCKPGTVRPSPDDVLAAFDGASAMRFGPLAAALGGESRVFRLLRAGELRVDLEQPLTDDSMVCLAGTEGGPNGSFHL
jgi:hypothetical protein